MKEQGNNRRNNIKKMKKVTYYSKVNADLWLELNRRMIKKSKAMMANMVLDFSNYPKKKLPEDHWFNHQSAIDLDLMEYEQIFMDNSCEMLDKIYTLLSDKDKNIIDEYNEEQSRESMAELYRELSSDDYGEGVYMSEGVYLQSDGTFTGE
jgi:hypothetical protein